MSLLLRGCNIVDAASPEVRRDFFVLVEGDTIARVDSGPSPSSDEVLDLEGMYLLPGLWDVHTHLRTGTWTGADEPQSPASAAMSHGAVAMEALQSGVTSLRVVGVRDWADVAWREAFDSGKFEGPRLYCCGHGLRGTAGHMASPVADPAIADGPAAFIKAVRNEIKHAVNQIKLVTTGGIMGTGHDVMPAVMLMRDEIRAAIRIATQRDVPVAVHATPPQAVKWAVEAGAHSIEHGYLLDEEAARLMAAKGTYYVPTLSLSHLTEDQAATPHEEGYCREHPLPEEFRGRANRYAPDHEESLRIALDAGVKVASGSDQGPPREAALLEIELLARCGLGPHGAIAAATRTAAEVCRADDRLGTVEPGKLADLIAVSANPLEDIHNLRRLVLVIKGGRVVVDRRGSSE